ncbi:MAG: hypothetical protein Q9M13_09545 [Mariprofundales bacterium]|nr:hypothetical protein [Mariprofundales bacterium]
MHAAAPLHKPTDSSSHPLRRRGRELGWITTTAASSKSYGEYRQQWQQLQAVLLPGIIRDNLQSVESHTARSLQWMSAIVEGTPPSQLLDSTPDHATPPLQFDLTAISTEEHDQQAIEKLYFQGYSGSDEPLGEVWCKISWLSFHDSDASLRFRFSFGTEGVESVADNPPQQQLAAALCQQLFPEAVAITENPHLLSLLHTIVDIEPISFVERIIYFNAPNGGALFHHDVEPGHIGVIYAQMTGRSYWLALSKQQLIAEIRRFVNQQKIELTCTDLADELNRAEHPELEEIIDHNPHFIRQLVERGFGYTLHAGDAILLAQTSDEEAVWHSVFCLGDEPGEGMSFAMRQRER